MLRSARRLQFVGVMLVALTGTVQSQGTSQIQEIRPTLAPPECSRFSREADRRACERGFQTSPTAQILTVAGHDLPSPALAEIRLPGGQCVVLPPSAITSSTDTSATILVTLKDPGSYSVRLRTLPQPESSPLSCGVTDPAATPWTAITVRVSCGLPLFVGTEQTGFADVLTLSNGFMTYSGNGCANAANFQCVEYAKRFYGNTGGVNIEWDSAENGWQLLRLRTDAFAVAENGLVQSPPQPGDMIFFDNGAWGHVAIVSYVNLDTGVVEVVDQNASLSGRHTYPIRLGDTGYDVSGALGWLRRHDSMTPRGRICAGSRCVDVGGTLQVDVAIGGVGTVVMLDQTTGQNTREWRSRFAETRAGATLLSNDPSAAWTFGPGRYELTLAVRDPVGVVGTVASILEVVEKPDRLIRFGDTLQLNVSNIDDVFTVKIDNEVIEEVGYFQEKTIDLVPYVQSGAERLLTLQLSNHEAAGWTYRYRLSNGMTFGDECGQVGTQGCTGNTNQPGGVVFTTTYRLVRSVAGAQSPTPRFTMAAGGVTVTDGETLAVAASANGTTIVSFTDTSEAGQECSVIGRTWIINDLVQDSITVSFATTFAAGTENIITLILSTDCQATPRTSGTVVVSARAVPPPSWAMLGHDAAHTGASQFSGPASLQSPARLVLPDNVSDVVAGPVIDSHGTTYFLMVTTDGDAGVYAFDGSGRAIQGWPHRGLTSVTSLAIGFDGTIYATGTNVYALNGDGTSKWPMPTVLPGPSGLAVVPQPDGNVAVATSTGVFMIDSFGAVLWQSIKPTNTIPATSPDGTVFASVNDELGGLAAYNPNGSLKWSTALDGSALFPTAVSSASIGSDGTVFFVKAMGRGGLLPTSLVGVDPSTGLVRHERALPAGVQSTFFAGQPAPSIGPDGTVYVVSNDQRLFGFSPNLQTIRFERSFAPYLPSGVLGPVIGADGVVYLALNRPSSGGTGLILALRPDGTVLSDFSGSATHYMPSGAISPDGTLYWTSSCCADADNRTILAFAASSGSVMDDDFDDGTFDLAKWTSNLDFAVTLTELDGRLRLSLPPARHPSIVAGSCSVNGDFDIQVDYSVSRPALNSYTLSLGTTVGNISRSVFSISPFDAYSFHGIRVATNDVAGTLRLIRTGTVLAGAFRDGVTWRHIDSITVSTTQARVFLYVDNVNDSLGGIEISFDNFRVNSGTLTCPQ